MKSLIHILFLSLSLLFNITHASLAELQGQLPKCSLECLASGASEHGCSIKDIGCMCSKMEAMIKTVSPCLVKAGCELIDITNTAKIVNQICAEGMAMANKNVTATDATASGFTRVSPSQTATVIPTTETPGAAARVMQNSALGAVVAAGVAILL